MDVSNLVLCKNIELNVREITIAMLTQNSVTTKTMSNKLKNEHSRNKAIS